MSNIIDKIDLLAEELKSLLPMKIEYQKQLDEKFRPEFNYNSNHLEGNTLTYGETKLLLMFEDTKGNHTLREYEEMRAHDIAYKFIQELAKEERPLTENVIKNLNEIILVRPFWKEAITADGQNTRRLIKVGEYKEQPNSVRLQNGEIYEYPSPSDVPILMGELLDWYRSEENNLYPLTLATMLHYKFVSIHPFDDGNGRVARLLMNYVLLKNNLPPVIIKSGDKENYLRALRVADIGDYEELIHFVGEQLIWSLDKYIKAGKGENIDDKDDLDKKLSMFKKQVETQDKEKEIKEMLSIDLIVDKYETWIKDLLGKIIKTTFKFNEFYTQKSHKVIFQFENNKKILMVDTISNLSLYFSTITREEQNLYQTISKGNIFFSASYGAYKNGGTNPFDCDYSVKIYFERYSYSIDIDYIDIEEDGLKKTKKIIPKRLLHIPMSDNEINEIDKLWGESLLNHLVFFSEKQKI